jgi:hypothetical protein
MTTYKVTFDRIGRNKAIKPLTVDADGIIQLGEKISDYAEPHIRSEYFEVGIDDDLSGGHIIAGMAHVAGCFTIEKHEKKAA